GEGRPSERTFGAGKEPRPDAGNSTAPDDPFQETGSPAETPAALEIECPVISLGPCSGLSTTAEDADESGPGVGLAQGRSILSRQRHPLGSTAGPAGPLRRVSPRAGPAAHRGLKGPGCAGPVHPPNRGGGGGPRGQVHGGGHSHRVGQDLVLQPPRAARDLAGTRLQGLIPFPDQGPCPGPRSE